jgi:hypothetical protein
MLFTASFTVASQFLTQKPMVTLALGCTSKPSSYNSLNELFFFSKTPIFAPDNLNGEK